MEFLGIEPGPGVLRPTFGIQGNVLADNLLQNVYRYDNLSTIRTDMNPSEQILQLARARGLLRSADLAGLGIPRTYLSRMLARGQLVRLERGLYGLPEHVPSEWHSLAVVSRKVPSGVICLLSALQFHGLTTQAPFEVWLAIPYRSRSPKLEYPPLRVVRYGAASLAVGLETHKVEGVEVRVFSLAKTLADCFKYRRQVGLDVALEALKEGWRERRFRVEEVLEYARVNRVDKVLRPYLEAVLA